MLRISLQRFAQHDKSRSKRIAHAYLRAEQVKAGIRIGLSAVGKMLIKRAHIQFPVIIHQVGNTRRRQNVEREILSLTARHFGVTVNPSGAYTARKIRNEPRVSLNEIVAKPHVESQVVIFDSFENRLRNRAYVELIIAAQPATLRMTPQRIRSVRNSAPIW